MADSQSLSRIALIVPSERAEEARILASEAGLLDNSVHPLRLEGEIAWPLLSEIDCNYGRTQIMRFDSREKIDPHARLAEALQGMTPPSRWQILEDLVLLPQDSLPDGDEGTWQAVAKALNCRRVARQAEVDPGPMRSSRIEMLLGNYGWVNHQENGVRYVFDASKVMFSSGNITERRRMGEVDAAGEVVVDLYAGIGYYTLPLICNAGVSKVHACEMNPHSIDALTKGLIANMVGDRCLIQRGDNQETAPMLKDCADRVILGLLPSSKKAWPLAVNCLKPEGGILHVHMNSDVDSLNDGSFVAATIQEFENLGCQVELIHLEDVKSYSPHVRHVVLDLAVKRT